MERSIAAGQDFVSLGVALVRGVYACLEAVGLRLAGKSASCSTARAWGEIECSAGKIVISSMSTSLQYSCRKGQLARRCKQTSQTTQTPTCGHVERQLELIAASEGGVATIMCIELSIGT